MKKKIEQIIIDTLEELNEELENPNLKEISSLTLLYGSEGNLDSLGLVNLISDIESKISDEFAKDISLADERAMSQRNSPFKSIESLTDFIDKLLKEEI